MAKECKYKLGKNKTMCERSIGIWKGHHTLIMFLDSTKLQHLTQYYITHLIHRTLCSIDLRCSYYKSNMRLRGDIKFF